MQGKEFQLGCSIFITLSLENALMAIASPDEITESW